MSRPQIIGLFGSNKPETATLAEAAAYDLVMRGCVVLSGGSGNPHLLSVKDQATAGALRGWAKTHQKCWIGLSRETMSSGLPNAEAGQSSLVIRTNLGHKRNFLGAWLCDAAIGFEGEQGTKSEVTFCLALAKPVLLVGDWKDYEPETNLVGIIHAARERIASNGSASVSEVFDRSIDTVLNGAITKFGSACAKASLSEAHEHGYWLSALDRLNNEYVCSTEERNFPAIDSKSRDAHEWRTVEAEYKRWLSTA